MGATFSTNTPGQWTTMIWGWFNSADFNTVKAFTSGTSFVMTFFGVQYNGTLTSNFIDGGGGMQYTANVSWSGSAPPIGSYTWPDSIVIGGYTFYARNPLRATFDYSSYSVAASVTKISLSGNNQYVTNWPDVSEFDTIRSRGVGAPVTIVYHGTTYTGTLTSTFTQPDPTNQPSLYAATVNWAGSAGLESYEDGVESITI
jgi:hypothetical protein